MGPDLFISFSSLNRDQVAPVVEALRQRRLNVWWSDELEEGRWDEQITEQLQKAKRVLGFVTPQVNLNTRDYVFQEFDYARTHDKLIPLIIGDGSSAFSIRGVISLLQSYYFEDFETLLDTAMFEKLVRVCGGEPADSCSVGMSSQATPIERIDTWYSRIEEKYGHTGRVTIFSMATAVAVFEHTSPGRVRQLAKQLENLLQEPSSVIPTSDEQLAPERLTPLLKEIACHLTNSSHIPISGEAGISFEDPERASEMLEFAWMEFGDRRDALSVWLNEVVATGHGDEVMRISFAIGLLAQRHFEDVFERLLEGWIFGRNTRQRYVADIAISVAAFEPRIALKVQEIMNNLSSHGSAERAKAAVRLASGYTAMRLPDAAIQTFRNVAEQRQVSVRADVFGEMQASLAAFLRLSAKSDYDADSETKRTETDTSSVESSEENSEQNDVATEFGLEGIEDDSLFDLPGLIVKLSGWALEDSDASDAPMTARVSTPYPLALVLFVLDEIRLVSPKQQPYLLSWGQLIAHPKTAEATAAIFSRALERHRFGEFESRRLALDVLRKRIKRIIKLKERHGVNAMRDPRYRTLLDLARLLFANASSKNDADRIAYLFKMLFNREELSDRRTKIY